MKHEQEQPERCFVWGARKRAGVPWLQLKDFRRELGIILAESGQPLHVAKTQLGHSSVRTTEQFLCSLLPGIRHFTGSGRPRATRNSAPVVRAAMELNRLGA